MIDIEKLVCKGKVAYFENGKAFKKVGKKLEPVAIQDLLVMGYRFESELNRGPRSPHCFSLKKGKKKRKKFFPFKKKETPAYIEKLGQKSPSLVERLGKGYIKNV